LTVRGELPPDGCLIAANHASHLDALAIFAACSPARANRLHALAAKDYFYRNSAAHAVAFWIAAEGLDMGGEICVFDAAGRQVRRLALPRAGGSMVWDGRDSFGREVPAGVYYIRLLGRPVTDGRANRAGTIDAGAGDAGTAGAGTGGGRTIAPEESGWGSVRAEAKVVRLR